MDSSMSASAEFPNACHSNNFDADTSVASPMAEVNVVKDGEAGEPGISTILMNLTDDFDPYDALSASLYQTATFKQVLLTAIWSSYKNQEEK